MLNSEILPLEELSRYLFLEIVELRNMRVRASSFLQIFKILTKNIDILNSLFYSSLLTEITIYYVRILKKQNEVLNIENI